MKRRFFTPTFTKFFVGFLCIIGVAFAVIAMASNYAQQAPRVDNTAKPSYAP